MATNAEIAAALSGLNISPLDNPYGLGANTIAKALPNLYNPYASVGTNIGVTLGGALLAGLLGYQAKKQATEASLVANQYATQMLAKTPEERLGLIQNLPEDVSSRTQIQNALLGLNTQLLGQQNALDLLGGQEVAKQKALAGYYATPEGKTAFEQELARMKAESQAKYAGLASMYGGGGGGGAGAEGATTKADEDKIRKLRQEALKLPEVKDLSKTLTAAETVAKAAQDPSAVASMELVKRAVHLIEPGLAALQGETEAVRKSASIPGAWKATLEQALTGQGGLDENVRAGIIRMSQRAYNTAKDKYDTVYNFYTNEAIKQNVDPNRVMYLGKAPTFEELTRKSTSNVESDINKLEAVLSNPNVSEATKAAAKAKIMELLSQ